MVIGGSQNGWFTRENLEFKMDDARVYPYFRKLPYGGFQSHGGPRKHPKLVSITVSTNGLGYKNILGNPHIAETLSTTNIPGSVFRMADTEKQV